MSKELKEYALLSVLEAHEVHGYALAEYFGASFGAYLGLNKSAIYASLRRFEDKGWVHVRTVEAQNYPDRKMLSLSAKGQEALAAYRAHPPTASTMLPDLALLLDSEIDPSVLEQRLLNKQAARAEKTQDAHRGHASEIYLQKMELAEISALKAAIAAIKKQSESA